MFVLSFNVINFFQLISFKPKTYDIFVLLSHKSHNNELLKIKLNAKIDWKLTQTSYCLLKFNIFKRNLGSSAIVSEVLILFLFLWNPFEDIICNFAGIYV